MAAGKSCSGFERGQNTIPQPSFGLDTVTDNVQIERLEDAQDDASAAEPMSIKNSVSEDYPETPDVPFRVTRTPWSEAEDQALRDSHERGMGAARIQE